MPPDAASHLCVWVAGTASTNSRLKTCSVRRRHTELLDLSHPSAFLQDFRLGTTATTQRREQHSRPALIASILVPELRHQCPLLNGDDRQTNPHQRNHCP